MWAAWESPTDVICGILCELDFMLVLDQHGMGKGIANFVDSRSLLKFTQASVWLSVFHYVKACNGAFSQASVAYNTAALIAASMPGNSNLNPACCVRSGSTRCPSSTTVEPSPSNTCPPGNIRPQPPGRTCPWTPTRGQQGL